MTQKLMQLGRKIIDHNHDKHIITLEFNKLTAENFAGILEQENLVTKTDFNNKLSSLNSILNKIIVSNRTKHLVVENELKKLKTFDSSYFHGKSHFEEDGTQNHLVFQPMRRYFKTVGNSDCNILSWKSKGLSDEKINSIKKTDYGLNPYLDFHDINKIRVKFNGDCLKQDHPTLLFHDEIINFYIVYEITDNSNVSSHQTLENCLFGIVKLTENADFDKYRYSSYGIGFDRKGFFSHPSGGTGRNVIMFGVDMSSSTKIDNGKKDILILGKGPTQG